ncbi:MAG TPA: hypothetical protein VGW38_13905 [Chloroflexota bacterium]|nr:hypothetical protein [Chloroflexota bacterium]
MTAIERLQTKAAELVLDDEGWRGRLDDDAATHLLNGVLEASDAAIARLLTCADVAERDEPSLDDIAYEVAHQSRLLLAVLARFVEGEPAEPAPELLGAPLFHSQEEAKSVLDRLLNAVRPEAGDQPRAQSEQRQDYR